MQTVQFNGRRIPPSRSQRGVVLLIALIMLVAMTLAAIGMMRSVDTGTVIAGNMAFKQATLSATDVGTNSGFSALMSVANSANINNKTLLNFTDGQNCATNAPLSTAVAAVGAVGTAGCTSAGAGTINIAGYSSMPLSPCEVTGQTTGTITVNIGGTNTTFNCATTAATYPRWWTSANWAAAPSITVNDPIGGGTIATVQYLIHRMCQLPNAAPTIVPTGTSPNQQLCQSVSYIPACHTTPCPPNITLYYYRITTRSVGVRNTVSYAQMWTLIGG